MIIHLHKEIEKLKKQLLTLCAVVEQGLRDSVRAITARDTALAQRVIEGDRAIDQAEIDVEEECLKILALYQPVASDLRFVVAILKINNDLERIADLAVNIAERALTIASIPQSPIPKALGDMEKKVQEMLKDAIDSLVNLNESLARDVLLRDEEVDRLHQGMYGLFEESILDMTDKIDYYTNLLSVSRYLERAADQATNIAEDVVYMVTGEIIRHSNTTTGNGQ